MVTVQQAGRRLAPARMAPRDVARVGAAGLRTRPTRALVGQPRVVLADEPTGNLDSATGAEILSLFQDLHRQGATLVVITHDQSVASACPRRVEMRDGLVVADVGGAS